SSIGSRMMSLDPTSTPLHAAAASLLRVGPLAAGGRVEEARGVVRAAALQIVPLAHRTTATPPATAPAPAADTAATDPALRGAVVDALRRPAGAKGLPQDDQAPPAARQQPHTRKGTRR